MLPSRQTLSRHDMLPLGPPNRSLPPSQSQVAAVTRSDPSRLRCVLLGSDTSVYVFARAAAFEHAGGNVGGWVTD